MKKKSVAVLGATGMVGRRLVELLMNHPWFEVVLLIGSGASVGEKYETVWEAKEQSLQEHYSGICWKQRPFPIQLKNKYIHGIEDILKHDIQFVFSSVPERATDAENTLLDYGFTVFSNSPYGRFEESNPLVVPEVNRCVMGAQKFIKNPNCVTSGLVLILSALMGHYDVEEVTVTTYQSLSGRGDAKYPRELVLGNIYPLHRSAENTEIYIAKEVKKILQKQLPISVSCHRVPVQEGHYVDLRIKTTRPVTSREAILALFQQYNPLHELHVPSSPEAPIVVVDEPGRPRPSQDAFYHGGMAVAVGNIAVDDEVYNLRLTYVVNNLIRGAAGGAILNAEVYFAAQE